MKRKKKCNKITPLLICAAFSFVLGCQSSNSSPKEENITTKPADKTIPKSGNIALISKWLDLRSVKLNGFEADETARVENVKYEGLKNVTRVNFNNDTSTYYFFDALGNFAVLYLNIEDAENLSTEEIIRTYGKPEKILRSRVGKTANHYVYSQHGFAFSERQGKVVFFEVFPSSNLKQYTSEIYVDPGVFRK